MKIIITILFFSIAIGKEVEFKEIRLSGLITDKKQEISGLEWYKDNLVLLPENLGGFYFMIPKETIKRYLRNYEPEPIEPRQVSFKTADYSKLIPGFQGFEAIAFKNEFVAITMEAKHNKKMHGYYAWGTINPKSFEITIPEKNLIELPVPVQLKNFTFESLLIHNDKAIVYYEANGRNLRKNSWQYTISIDKQEIGKIEHPFIEYRINDVTRMDRFKKFWAINYLWSGDRKLLDPADDVIFEDYTEGITHSKIDGVERLVEFQIVDDKIQASNRAPIQLVLKEKESRNWEGIVRLDKRGFLIATDKYPRMILAFVPLN
ncbi:MAG: hypothetical protein CMG74_08620 [Candidatus Marinimicrobia bacterium]|nr:hypothetical protein [Candidatus Neomarinimicrobiota bacterium]|tara:strand:- start:534 stop:1490 length:957 start_codon:yes stop_codon:yes gene_type:complete